MKNLLEPRAVLWIPDDAGARAAAEAFRWVGIEAYRTESLASAQKMALRDASGRTEPPGVHEVVLGPRPRDPRHPTGLDPYRAAW